MDASESNPVNASRLKWSRLAASAQISGWFLRRYSPAITKKPAVPAAGSMIVSVGGGAVMSTMRLMMWRGVGNWPLVPALASLPSMYS